MAAYSCLTGSKIVPLTVYQILFWAPATPKVEPNCKIHFFSSLNLEEMPLRRVQKHNFKCCRAEAAMSAFLCRFFGNRRVLCRLRLETSAFQKQSKQSLVQSSDNGSNVICVTG